MFTTLISSQDLRALREDGSRHSVVIDCSFDLADPAAGREAYQVAHVIGLASRGRVGQVETAVDHDAVAAAVFAQRAQVLAGDQGGEHGVTLGWDGRALTALAAG